MKFLRLGGNTLLNLDSVASITWEGKGLSLVAIVKYLVPSSTKGRDQGQLAYERFTGHAAQTLHRHLGAESGAPLDEHDSSSSSAGGLRRTHAKNQIPPASLDMLASGLGKKKGWYFVRSANDRQYFLAMVNMKGSCSMRTFDAQTGRFLGKQYAHGDFQEQFARYLQDAKELTISRQPNLERECREQLPAEALAYLQRQVLQES